MKQTTIFGLFCLLLLFVTQIGCIKKEPSPADKQTPNEISSESHQPEQSPQYERAKSPEACLRNVHLAADARDLDGLKACFVDDAKEIIELSRPRVQEVAQAADELLRTLRENGLESAANRMADSLIIKLYLEFDDDLFLQFSKFKVAKRSIKEMNETTAIVIEERRETYPDGLEETLEHHLLLQDTDWKLLPHLPPCLILYTEYFGVGLRGRPYVAPTPTSYAEARSSLNVLVEVKKMFAQLTASVAAGRFDDEKEFFRAFNNSAEALTK